MEVSVIWEFSELSCWGIRWHFNSCGLFGQRLRASLKHPLDGKRVMRLLICCGIEGLVGVVRILERNKMTWCYATCLPLFLAVTPLATKITQFTRRLPLLSAITFITTKRAPLTAFFAVRQGRSSAVYERPTQGLEGGYCMHARSGAGVAGVEFSFVWLSQESNRHLSL